MPETIQIRFRAWRQFGYSDFSMQCAECSRLLAEHERLKGELEVARARLHEGMVQQITVAEYRALLMAASETLLDVGVAELELERHRGIHVKAN